MKKTLFLIYFSMGLFGLWAQQFSIPSGAVLLESTEFKNNGVPYVVKRRYKLPSEEILYAYYDVEGSNSVTIQKIEQAPILSVGTDINIPGMPGYREFNFGDDKRKLVQFMKLFKLGQKDYRGNVKTPSLSDSIFGKVTARHTSDFKLLLDLYDENWVLEHLEMDGNRVIYSNTTAIFHTNRFID
jgi:hypothetical protein